MFLDTEICGDKQTIYFRNLKIQNFLFSGEISIWIDHNDYRLPIYKIEVNIQEENNRIKTRGLNIFIEENIDKLTSVLTEEKMKDELKKLIKKYLKENR